MKLHSQCPGCQTKFNFKQEHVGRKATCPQCGTKFTVQDPTKEKAEVIAPPRISDMAPSAKKKRAEAADTAAAKQIPMAAVLKQKHRDTRPGPGSLASRLAGASGASCPSRIPMNPVRFAIRNPLVPLVLVALLVGLLFWQLSNEKFSTGKSSRVPVSAAQQDGFQLMQNRIDQMNHLRSRREPFGTTIAPPALSSVNENASNWINKERLRKYGTLFGLFLGFGGMYFYLKFRHFMRGDGNPGVVIALNPTLVAVATDLGQGPTKYPAVKIIRTKLKRSQGKELEVGAIIATAAQYGTAAFGNNKEYFASFDPVPVEEATSNQSYIASLVQSFDQEQYDLLKFVDHLPKPYQPGLYHMWADGDQHPPRRVRGSLLG